MDLLKKTVSSVQCNLAADSRYLSKQKSQRTRPNVKEYHDRAVFLQRWTCFTLTTNILSMVSICKQKYEYNCKLCTNMYFILSMHVFQRYLNDLNQLYYFQFCSVR